MKEAHIFKLDSWVKVITPVSRTFGVNPWIMWDWDTYFLSLMAAESDELLGYSNVLTVTRGRTIRGQVSMGNSSNNVRERSVISCLT